MNENSFKKFCKYFDTLDELGIGYGLVDLFDKANELELQPPEDFKIAN